MVAIRPSSDGRRVRLTDAGRRRGIQLLAADRSTEADSERGLDEGEARLLKMLLKRVIREIDCNRPDVGRKENVWRENNIRGGGAAALQSNREGSQS
jgi:hypothetical protein